MGLERWKIIPTNTHCSRILLRKHFTSGFCCPCAVPGIWEEGLAIKELLIGQVGVAVASPLISGLPLSLLSEALVHQFPALTRSSWSLEKTWRTPTVSTAARGESISSPSSVTKVTWPTICSPVTTFLLQHSWRPIQLSLTYLATVEP